MQLKKLLSLLLVAFLLGVSITPAAAQGNAPSFEPAPCPFSIPAGETIQCGYVSLPENRAAPNGATIRLAVAIVKSHNPHSAPDPVVFLHGGPAVPILFQLPELLAVFKPILASRDMIFFDQRGVGESKPTLGCPEFMEYALETAQKNLLPTIRQSQLVEAVAACRTRLSKAGVDLTQYTSAISAADVADLRTALGYTEWNIYAGSYGTRVALEVLRSHPTGIRSVILDSPVPPQANLLDNMPSDIQQAFENLFQNCAEDWACRFAYPNLKEVFDAEVKRLNAQPATVTITSNNNSTTQLLSGNDLIDTLYNGLLSRQLTPFLPSIIYDAQDGNYEKFAQLRALNQKLGEQFALGTYLSTTCSEEAPFNSLTLQTSIQPLFQDYLTSYRTFNGFFIQTLCRAWLTLPPSDTASLAVTSDLPTLIFAGKLDPLTPPAQARLTASTLRRSFVYEFPGLSHGVLTSLCPMAMASNFLDNPTQAPNASCISQLDTTPNFFIRTAAARLPAQLLIGLLSLSLLAVLVRNLFSYQPSVVSFQSVMLSLRFANRLFPLLSLAALSFFFIVGDLGGTPFLQRLRLIATILPLFAGLQAASLFSPEDEPALEVTLACPRPLAWILLERLATLFGAQGGLALIGSLLINVLLGGDSLSLAIMRWLPPMLCLVAVALTLTLNSRQSIFSAGAIVLLWFGFAWGGDPLVQLVPFLWPLHLYLQPDHPFFWLNRALLSLLGLNLIAFAVIYLIRDEERVLLGDSPAQNAKRDSSTQSVTFPYCIVPNLSSLQLLAFLRYEFLINWRRRVLPIFFLASMTLPLLAIFLAVMRIGDVNQFVIPSASLTAEAARQTSTTSLLILTWAPLFMVLIILLPPAVAETIPRDQQLGARELLNSLPITSETYLGGKLLSLWFSLLAGIVGVLVVVGVVWWFAISPFDIGIYVQMMVLGAFPVAALNSGLSLLLAANQPNRRRAIVIGVVFCIFSLVTIVLSIRPNANPLLQLFNTSHTNLFTYFLWGWTGVSSSILKIAAWTDVLWDLGIGLAQLVIVGLIAWGWMRWQDGRQ